MFFPFVSHHSPTRRAGWYAAASVRLINTCHYVQVHSGEALVCVRGPACVCFCVWVTSSVSRCRIQLLFGDTACGEARSERMWLPKAGFTATAGVRVCVCSSAWVCFGIRTGARHVKLSNVHVAAAKLRTHAHRRVHCDIETQRGWRTAHTSAASALQLLFRLTVGRMRREGGDMDGGGGWDGSEMTGCKVISTGYGCRKSYIKCVLRVWNHSKRGLIRQKRFYRRLPFVTRPAVRQRRVIVIIWDDQTEPSSSKCCLPCAEPLVSSLILVRKGQNTTAYFHKSTIYLLCTLCGSQWRQKE